AVVLYNKRPLEANGEVVAFKVLRPLFIYGVALGSGMLGYLYFSKIISGNVFFLLPFGIIGIIIAWMLARKSFSLRGAQKPIIVFTLAVLVLFVFVHFDLTGYEKRVPELADVESVRIDDSVKLDKEQSKIYFGQKGFITYDQSYDPGLKSEADVKNVIFLHEYKIAHREKSTSARTIPIVYTLKNGKVLKRQYSIDPIKDAKYLKPLYETREMRGFRYALTDGTAKVITRVDLYDDRLCGGTGISYSGENNENVKALTEALKKDLLSLPYEEDTTLIDRASSPCTYLCFSYYKKGTLDSGEKASVQDLLRYPITETYYITDSYKNTMALLEKMGLFNGILKAGDITEIGINNYKNESINYAYNCVLSTGTECMYKIADKKDIDEIFDFAVNSYKVVTNNTQDTGNLELTFVSKYGTVFTRNIYCDTKLWPKAIKDALGK
ncbi:MAG: DUF6449 domain-containing protein, partial [Bacillota bacterium]|nr:DUF6449 domain-containing protein [Bacillota bacterium]